MSKIPNKAWAAIAALAALLATGLVINFISTDENGKQTTHTITIRTNTAPDDGHATQTVTAPKKTVDSLAKKVTNLHDETPPGMTEAQKNAVAQQAEHIRATQEPLPTAGASAGFLGCATRFVRNQSGRGGIRPQWQVWHYTVSHNVPGWADVNSVVALFDRSSSQASSNFVIDAEGNCAYIVPIEAKAWTQAAGNPFSISYEIIDYGTEKTFMNTAGYAKLRSVMLQVKARTGIPMQLGSTNGSCSPGKTGIIQHADLGICGGGHHDINPFSKVGIFAIVSQGAVAKPPSKTAIVDCRGVVRYRVKAAKHIKQGAGAKKLYLARQRALKKGKYVCGRHGTKMVLRRA